MFKIIIADDEAIFREYLSGLIEWENYGFEICCEAKNGVEALEKIKWHKPDIALIDINMPFLDGLGLVEKINEFRKDMAIILITGHSEFEYARKAVKLGVVDYILKPFDKEELLMTLLKIKGSLQKLRDDRDTEKSNQNLIKERFLNMLISGEIAAGNEEIVLQLNRFDIALELLDFTVVSIEIDNMYSLWNDAKEVALWKFAVSNILNEILGNESKHVIFNGPEGRIISILELDKSNTSQDNCTEKFKRICELVKRYLKFTITVGIGNRCNGIKDIRNSYLESVIALQNKVVASDSKVILFSNLGNDSMSIGFYPNEINEKILIALRTNDREDVLKLLDDVFLYIKDRRLSFEYINIVVIGLVSLCLSYVNEIGKNIDQVFGKDFSPFTQIKSKSTLDALKQWCAGIFETLLLFCDDSRSTKSKKTVESVIEFIEENYTDSSLSVEGIANSIYINASYLRKIFKKELNMSVNDYIIDIRMIKAREMIGSGNIKLSDISEKIGYNDAGYFSKSFKKKFGFSPSEYENLKRK